MDPNLFLKFRISFIINKPLCYNDSELVAKMDYYNDNVFDLGSAAKSDKSTVGF